ncbi:type II secretion system protein [Methylophaga sp. OBS3]|uniref:type II secretion system protein n=1 Tax=Methylophaga sp. OBS3 TaxID=2991934 RepID=UPI00224CA195|nr:type II secretion system protein [Methylophaga sp. OBS3]MCX4189160.1 type II secretion system GspH family protein [Methylophaga sp. OBS3]
MNIQQIKSAIAKFRKADMSMIKDEKLRAKGQKLQAKEKGFTLLELLVVITLLAILATGALVAYDGTGDKAQSAKAAHTVAVMDQGVRAFKAVTQAYPDQWDNLADPVDADTPAGGTDYIPEGLQNILGSFNLATAMSDTLNYDLEEYFDDAFGMEEIQHVFGGADGLNGVAPNRAHNEGSNPPTTTGGAVETEYGDFAATGIQGTNTVEGVPAYISILASQAEARDGAAMDCSVGDVANSINTTWAGTTADPLVINSINDALSTQRCNLVLALGFGGDAAQNTVDSAAGVVQSPTYSSVNVNPAENYARYVGLFLLARGEKADNATGFGNGTSVLVRDNFLPRPRLLGFIDTEGNTIDANIAAATQN